MSTIDRRPYLALLVIGVQQWGRYDFTPLRPCDLTTTVEAFTNG